MFTGILAALAGFATFGYRWVLTETKTESPAMPVDPTAEVELAQDAA
jgi:hypothetical protein